MANLYSGPSGASATGSNTQTNSGPTGPANVASLQNAMSTTQIRIDLNREFYGITETELTIIEEGSSPIEKDLCFGTIGLGLPCIINAAIENSKSTEFNSEIFWNALVGGVSVVAGVYFLYKWLTSKSKAKELMSQVKQRQTYNF